MHFTKMHGIGNDFLIVNGSEEYVSDPRDLAVRMCAPHTGAGADGLVLLDTDERSSCTMRIFNRDGSEAEMCGNAARCVGRYLFEKGLTGQRELDLKTAAGIRHLTLDVLEDKVRAVTVDMGTPELDPRLIPVDLPGRMVLRHRVPVLGQMWFITCVSMGNPHCVVSVRDPEVLDLGTIGPMFEHHPLFPRGTNAVFVRAADRGMLQVRAWERGVGETLACGTGACAALVASVLSGQCDRTARVRLSGGELSVCWHPDDNHVYQSGEADFVFEGEWL